MLTVKIRHKGIETIHEAHSVLSHVHDTQDHPNFMRIDTGKEMLEHHSQPDPSIVYVMNDMGKTIGKYHFDPVKP